MTQLHRSVEARRQRGVTLVVGLIMVVLITLLVLNAFTLSSSNLVAVNNTQIRNEAVAAANQAIEQLVSTSFGGTGTQTFNIDIEKDGTTDYQVTIDPAPVCTKSYQLPGCGGSDCSTGPCGQAYDSGSSASGGTGGCAYLQDWDVKANVNHAATGTKLVIRQGVRIPAGSSCS